MKSQTSMIALLTFTALILSVMLFITPAQKPAQADVLAPAGDLTLLTSMGYTQFGYVNMLNVVDERDGLLLTYYLNNETLQPLGVYNLATQTNPPPLH